MNKFMIGFLRCLVFTIAILIVVSLLTLFPYWLITTAGTVGMVISCIIWLFAFCALGAHLFDDEDYNIFYIPPSVYRSKK